MGTHPIFESDFDCLTEMKLLLLVGLVLAQNTTESTTSTTKTTTEKTTTPTPVDPIPTGDDGIVRVTRDNETCAMIQFEGSFTLDQVTGQISSNNSALMP